jgi:hypothetical protein
MAASVLTETSRWNWTDDIDAPVRQVDHGPPPRFLPLRMNETLSISQCLPGPGEIFMFRFRSQWQRVSAHDAATWLTQDETRRAALLPSPALRYRYISSRAVLRLAVGRLLGCRPDTVDLRDDAKGRLFAQDARGEVVLSADIAYAGVWIMLGISANYLGLGTSLPSLKMASNDAPLPSALSTAPDGLLFGKQRARDNSLLSAAGYRSAIDNSSSASRGLAPLSGAASASLSGRESERESWYVFDLPMPGQLCASVCSSTPLDTILAFGWSKRNDA